MKTLAKQNNSIGIFGYGSLVNTTSLMQTIGRKPNEIQHISLPGFIRTWNVVVANNSPRGRFYLPDGTTPPSILALNIEPTGKNIDVNGVLFDGTEKDLELLDLRESHYSRIDITYQITQPHEYQRIYTYVGKPEYLVSKSTQAIIPKSYLETVASGFKDLNENAYESFINSTATSNFQTVPTTYVLL